MAMALSFLDKDADAGIGINKACGDWAMVNSFEPPCLLNHKKILVKVLKILIVDIVL
jgi:hypothetical protein